MLFTALTDAELSELRTRIYRAVVCLFTACTAWHSLMGTPVPGSEEHRKMWAKSDLLTHAGREQRELLEEIGAEHERRRQEHLRQARIASILAEDEQDWQELRIAEMIETADRADDPLKMEATAKNV